MSSLDLTEYHMSPLACDKITIALRKNSSVESVYLNNCCIGDNGVAKFCDVLRNNSSIELLCLFGNSVGAHGVESLCFALEQNTVLTSLDLRGNDVEDDGARTLGDLLRKNSAIQSLDIGSNPAITSQGVAALAAGLKENSTMQHLGISAGRFSSTIQTLLRRNRKDRAHKEQRILHLKQLLASDRMSQQDFDAAIGRIHHPAKQQQPDERNDDGVGDGEVVTDESNSQFDTYKSNMSAALGNYYAKKSSNTLDNTSNSEKAASYSVQDTLQLAFAEFDADNSGVIDSGELSNLLTALGYPMEGADLEQLVLWLDKSGDGQISLEEFQAWWLSS
jgi:hypothetical protein